MKLFLKILMKNNAVLEKMTQSPDILAACDLLQWGSGVSPIKIFKNYVKWCSFLPSEFIYSTEVILENLDKKQCFLGENIQKPWYTNSLRPASMGVWGVTPGNFQNLEAKWCIFQHSECIYSTNFFLFWKFRWKTAFWQKIIKGHTALSQRGFAWA